MSREDDPTGGERINKNGDEFSIGFLGTWGGFLAVILVVALIVADLGLGPFFLWAQADSNGLELDPVAWSAPIVFSIATTGLLYGLWETIRNSYSQRWLKLVAIAINIGDTLVDIGGANYLITQDPEAGQKFWPPEGTPEHQVVLIYVLGLACFFHEPLLGWLLGKYTSSVDPAAEYGEPGFGEKVEELLVKVAGVIMNTVKFIGKVGATMALPLLDVILMPLLTTRKEDPVSYWILWGLSLSLTAIQASLWRRTREMGGIKATMALSKKDAWMVRILLVLILVDTYFDIRGYNQALYGEGGNEFNIILQPTVSWVITISILAVLCSMGELLGREVFGILGRKARTKRLNGKGGSPPGGKPSGRSPFG